MRLSLHRHIKLQDEDLHVDIYIYTHTLINHLEYCGRIANLTVARTFMDVYGRTTRSYLLADMVSHCRCFRRWLLAAVQLRPGFARQRCHVTEREATGID